MTKLHRKDLKQDEIREKVGEAVKSITLHRTQMIYIITTVIVIGFITFAWSYYDSRQKEQSQQLLGAALEKLEAPVGDPPAEPDPNAPKETLRFKTDTEKYTAALKEFELISGKYGNTPAAGMARYQAGICAFYLNDYPKAEQYLKQSGKTQDKNVLYSLSRIALADVYVATGKADQAVQVLKEAMDNGKNNVPPETLLMNLGAAYEKAGKTKEARETYQKVLDQYKDSPISYEAQLKVNELKEK